MRSQPTLAEQRAMATRMALRGIARQPGAFVEKAWRNLLHLVRPDGLQLLLVVEEPMPAWRHAALVFLDDLIVLPAVVLFAVFLIAGRPSPERRLIGAWTAYYLLMVVVLFHNEIRYRSTLLPFALAGAAAGWALLARREGAAWRVRLALALGGGLALLVVAPYVNPGVRALRSLPALRAMVRPSKRGDTAAARRQPRRAAQADPDSARPWLRYGRALARHGDPAGALEAYEAGPGTARPRLGADRGAARAADRGRTNRGSGSRDRGSERVLVERRPWLALEVAWRELPAPVTDEIRLGAGDYGAVRGFSNPRREYRWTRTGPGCASVPRPRRRLRRHALDGLAGAVASRDARRARHDQRWAGEPFHARGRDRPLPGGGRPRRGWSRHGEAGRAHLEPRARARGAGDRGRAHDGDPRLHSRLRSLSRSSP
jgi:hypothetical protein